jgi:hypothetical protein
MKFLCLGYYNAADFNKLSEVEQKAIMDPCYAQCIPFRATGKVVEEEGLAPVHTSKCIRTRNGKQRVTDGPFCETKEQLGSFFVIEAENIEEAIKVASIHPGAMFGEELGFGIEVRPCQFF